MSAPWMILNEENYERLMEQNPYECQRLIDRFERDMMSIEYDQEDESDAYNWEVGELRVALDQDIEEALQEYDE